MSALSTEFANLKSIKEVIHEFNIKPDKNLGQNFLLNSDVPDKMTLYAGSLADQTVVEVGPGPGILTRSLLASNARQIIAIEMDERCLRALAPLRDVAGGRLDLIQNDAMRVNWDGIASGDRYSIIANLPYNIATPLLINWHRESRINQIIVMIQKEVAERFCATSEDDSYGKLSILTQSRWQAEILFDVAPEEFFPPPKVTSSVIRFTPQENPLDEGSYSKLEKLCTVAFTHRRKMVKTGLKQLFPNIEEVLEAVGARIDSRAEQISLPQYINLMKML